MEVLIKEGSSEVDLVFLFNKGGQISTTGSGSGSSGRYVMSKSTSSKTSTVNGVKKTVKTTKIKWSDGTEEEEVEESTSH